ncbi:MAG: hypothetical protein KDG55_10475 [Rhodocyclaceae bacterium]|nr:hypothetical protein [Rhodocyclaceae bacterium]
MPVFIVSLSYTSPIEEIERFLPEHVVFLDRHYAAGRFLLSGRKVPRTGGVILALADSRTALERLLAEDPFQREGLARYELTEMVPTRSAPALGFLLEA